MKLILFGSCIQRYKCCLFKRVTKMSAFMNKYRRKYKNWVILTILLYSIFITVLAFWTMPSQQIVKHGITDYKNLPIFENKFGLSKVQLQTTGYDYYPKLIKSYSNLQLKEFPDNTIAVGGGITSTGVTGWTGKNIPEKFQFFNLLLVTFCQTASRGFSYQFYLAYDHNDPFFSNDTMRTAFGNHFHSLSEKCCGFKELKLGLHFHVSSSEKKPALSQHDAMIEAYLDGATFFYRINDDTNMTTSNWTEAFIETLSHHKPPFVGITGPNHRGGNTAVMTYEFVHRTHMDVFGLYYPSGLPLFADQWLTAVYEPNHATKVKHIDLHHLGEYPRYPNTKYQLKDTTDLLDKYIPIFQRYLKYRSVPAVVPSSRKIIAISLYKTDLVHTWGAIRNAQLTPVIYPGWMLRVYMLDPEGSTESDTDGTTINKMIIPQRIITTLRRLGAQIAYVSTKTKVPPQMWSHLVALDEKVDYFVIRDAEARLSDREAEAVRQWVRSGMIFHCMRDHPDHRSLPIVQDAWGARAEAFRKLLGGSEQFLKKLRSQSDLIEILWPVIQHVSFCHDSMSCDEWPDSYPFPVARSGEEFIGQKYNERNQYADKKHVMLSNFTVSEKCAYRSL